MLKASPITCPRCGDHFAPTSHQRKAMANGRVAYCSRMCLHAAGSETRECAHCHGPVTRRKSEFHTDGPVTCSVACRGAVRRNRTTISCGTCGNPVERVPSAANGPVYCSRECYHVAERAAGGLAPCGCGCGAEVPVRGARRERARQGHPVFASRECQKRSAQVELPCSGPGCATKVHRYRSQMDGRASGHVFCDDCLAAGNTAFKPRRGQTLTCEHCNGDYYRSPSMVAGSRFCSDECRDAAATEARVDKVCEWCGEPFTVIYARRAQKFDTVECRDLARITRAIPGQYHNGKPKRWSDDGYVLVWEPDYPGTTYHGWVFEHRLVVERTHGIKLTSADEVDHIDEVKDNNDPTNLRVVDKVTHQGITVANLKRRRERDRVELEQLRAEKALRSQGYRPVGEVTEEALRYLEEYAASATPEQLEALRSLAERAARRLDGPAA